jgi:uncharacterized protein (DUF1330 family)
LRLFAVGPGRPSFDHTGEPTQLPQGRRRAAGLIDRWSADVSLSKGVGRPGRSAPIVPVHCVREDFMSSYFVALIDIHDTAGYERYLAGFDAVFANFGGKVVCVEDQPRVLEGEWPAARTVIIRFPGDAELRRWYESP